MSPIFNWSKAFLTHLPSVDEQHLQLINLINDLAEQVSSAKVFEQQTFAATCDALLDYAGFHFGDEEFQMDKSRLDPRHLAYHRDQHQAFFNEVSRLSETSSASREEALMLVEYLFRWLAYHILDVDHSMARQLRAIRDGASPAQAFENDVRAQTSTAEPLLAALSALYHVVLNSNRKLDSLNRELEQQVRQRTIDLEVANRELQLLSTHDELTGLPNRRFANQSLDQLWMEFKRYRSQLSVLILDADHFKQVNDRFGHAEGDALLRILASRLRDSVRQCDIVCRLGGDEFMVICPRTSQSQATNLARNILAAKQSFHTADGVECWDGGISIGIAEAGEAMTRFDDLLRAADQALYTAKQQGGSRMASHGV